MTLAADLIALRAARARRPFAPGELPGDAGAAYRVAAVTLDGRAVAAWKLGATTAGTRATFATETIYFGALVAGEVWHVGDPALVPPPVLRGEAEIAVRLGRDVAAGEDVSAVADAALFDAWAPALECPYSAIENIPEAGLTALLADRCAAGALFVGAVRDGIDAAAMDGELAIVVDGAVAAAARPGAALLMPPLAAARGFLVEAARQGVALGAGQWISTGGVTACIALPPDRPVALRFAGVDEFGLALAAGVAA